MRSVRRSSVERAWPRAEADRRGGVRAGHPATPDPSRAEQGVFSTRSPDRPNPIGLHRVRVREVAGNRLKVGPLEAIDGTPIVDIKPVLAVADG